MCFRADAPLNRQIPPSATISDSSAMLSKQNARDYAGGADTATRAFPPLNNQG
ncbi:MAG: hypothetical protein KGI39_03890 [Patescibacteria group bacterium]|nr:hypothetical protein [Patescibacteria group bacterium]